MAKTVGQMTEGELARFIQAVIRQTQVNLPVSLTLQKLVATQKLTVVDELELSPKAIAYLHQVMGV